MTPTEIELHEYQTTTTKDGRTIPITVYYTTTMGVDIKTVSDESGDFVSLGSSEQDRIKDEISDNPKGKAV